MRRLAFLVLAAALPVSAPHDASALAWLAGPRVPAPVLVQAPGDPMLSQALRDKVPEAAELRTLAAERGFVRVIVQFVSPVAPGEVTPDPKALAAVRAKIAAAQDAIIAKHFASAERPAEGAGFARGLVRMDITPQFAVNVTFAELEALAADARVRHIQYDRPVPPAR